MRTRVLLLGGQTIALGLMMAFLVVPASALFLDEYGADRLAYAYLAVAAAGVAVSSALSRFQRQVSLAALTAGVFTTYLVIVATAWAVLTLTDGVWVTFPLLVLFPLSIPTGFALVGGQSGRLLDVRQMKAYFPRVAAGFSVGFALGGVAAALLVGPFGGPDQLLAVDVVAAAAMVGLVVATGRRYPVELRATPKQGTSSPSAASSESRRVLLRNRLVVLLFGYQILSAAVTQLLDFMVWERAAARYVDPSDLARFQGVFGAIINVTSVLFVVFLAGWMLTRFGIGLGLLANPVVVLALLFVTSVVGMLTGTGAFMFFAFVCAQQVIDLTLTDGTTRTSINATYQALLPHQRLQAQTMIEGAGVPIALGVVGGLLLVQNALGVGIGAVLIVTIVLTVAWTVLSVRAFREYGANLREVLTRRAWDPVALRIDDEVSRDAVQSLLASGDLRDTETALEALADADSPYLAAQVAVLLTDSDPVRRRLAAEVAGAAGLVATDTVGPSVRALLQDQDDAVRLAAAAVLAGSAGEAGQEARASWVAATRGDDAALRTALACAAQSPDPFFVPYLVDLAGAPSAPAELFDALVAHSEQLHPVVERLQRAVDVSPVAKQRILAALGEAGTPGSRTLLLGLVADPDADVAEAAARALVASGHREEPDAPALEEAVTAQATRAARCLHLLAVLPEAPGTEPLRGALEDEVVLAGRRTEVLLGLVYEPRVIGFGVAGLRSQVQRERNTALEALEVTVGRRKASLLLAFAGLDHDGPGRLALFDEYAEVETLSVTQGLHDLVLDKQRYWDEPWLRAGALYAVPALAPGDAVSLATPYLDDADPDVAETARWLLDE